MKQQSVRLELASDLHPFVHFYEMNMNKFYKNHYFNLINDHKTTLLTGLGGLAGHSDRATASHRVVLSAMSPSVLSSSLSWSTIQKQIDSAKNSQYSSLITSIWPLLNLLTIKELLEQFYLLDIFALFSFPGVMYCQYMATSLEGWRVVVDPVAVEQHKVVLRIQELP